MIHPQTLYFGQQHVGTVQEFGPLYHTVPITEIPHYHFLLGRKDVYMKYLHASWAYLYPAKNTEKNREKKIQKFMGLLQDIKENGVNKPIITCRRPDGKMIIVDGNHRASISLFLNREVPYEEIKMEDYLFQITRIPKDFFGSQHRDMPYQSIFFKGKEWVTGRRNDILQRMNMIDRQDLVGKKVLDMGCNIGASSFLSAECGAKKVIGIEYNPNIITSAIKINVLFALPCEFKNLNCAEPIQTERCDTALVFSIDKHINNDEILAANIKQNVNNIVYFECHARSDIPDPVKRIFSSNELIGYTGEGKRKFYRCVI